MNADTIDDPIQSCSPGQTGAIYGVVRSLTSNSPAAADCSTACTQDADCDAWSWSSAAKTCTIFSKMYGQPRTTSSTCCWGTRSAPGPKPGPVPGFQPYGGTFYPGVNMVGFDLGMATSLDEPCCGPNILPDPNRYAGASAVSSGPADPFADLDPNGAMCPAISCISNDEILWAKKEDFSILRFPISPSLIFTKDAAPPNLTMPDTAPTFSDGRTKFSEVWDAYSSDMSSKPGSTRPGVTDPDMQQNQPVLWNSKGMCTHYPLDKDNKPVTGNGYIGNHGGTYLQAVRQAVANGFTVIIDLHANAEHFCTFKGDPMRPEDFESVWYWIAWYIANDTTSLPAPGKGDGVQTSSDPTGKTLSQCSDQLIFELYNEPGSFPLYSCSMGATAGQFGAPNCNALSTWGGDSSLGSGQESGYAWSASSAGARWQKSPPPRQRVANTDNAPLTGKGTAYASDSTLPGQAAWPGSCVVDSNGKALATYNEGRDMILFAPGGSCQSVSSSDSDADHCKSQSLEIQACQSPDVPNEENGKFLYGSPCPATLGTVAKPNPADGCTGFYPNEYPALPQTQADWLANSADCSREEVGPNGTQTVRGKSVNGCWGYAGCTWSGPETAKGTPNCICCTGGGAGATGADGNKGKGPCVWQGQNVGTGTQANPDLPFYNLYCLPKASAKGYTGHGIAGMGDPSVWGCYDASPTHIQDQVGGAYAGSTMYQCNMAGLPSNDGGLSFNDVVVQGITCTTCNSINCCQAATAGDFPDITNVKLTCGVGSDSGNDYASANGLTACITSAERSASGVSAYDCSKVDQATNCADTGNLPDLTAVKPETYTKNSEDVLRAFPGQYAGCCSDPYGGTGVCPYTGASGDSGNINLCTEGSYSYSQAVSGGGPPAFYPVKIGPAGNVYPNPDWWNSTSLPPDSQPYYADCYGQSNFPQYLLNEADKDNPPYPDVSYAKSSNGPASNPACSSPDPAVARYMISYFQYWQKPAYNAIRRAWKDKNVAAEKQVYILMTTYNDNSGLHSWNQLLNEEAGSRGNFEYLAYQVQQLCINSTDREQRIGFAAHQYCDGPNWSGLTNAMNGCSMQFTTGSDPKYGGAPNVNGGGYASWIRNADAILNQYKITVGDKSQALRWILTEGNVVCGTDAGQTSGDSSCIVARKSGSIPDTLQQQGYAAPYRDFLWMLAHRSETCVGFTLWHANIMPFWNNFAGPAGAGSMGPNNPEYFGWWKSLYGNSDANPDQCMLSWVPPPALTPQSDQSEDQSEVTQDGIVQDPQIPDGGVLSMPACYFFGDKALLWHDKSKAAYPDAWK